MAAKRTKTKTANKTTKRAKSKRAAMPKAVDQSTKEIRWTPAKKALIRGMRKLGATTDAKARTVDEIAEAAALEEAQVKHQCKPHFDLAMQAVIVATQREDE